MTLWTVACQAPLSMGFSRQEYWSGLPHLPGNLPDLGIEPMSLISSSLLTPLPLYMGLLSGCGKDSACNAGDTGNVGLIPGLGRSWKRK